MPCQKAVYCQEQKAHRHGMEVFLQSLLSMLPLQSCDCQVDHRSLESELGSATQE